MPGSGAASAPEPEDFVRARDSKLDESLEETFPASDPPAHGVLEH